jgi:hypothetical protein
MLTVTQRLMSGLGQAGSDWAWSVSINDIASSASISYSPPQVTEASCASEEPVSEPKTKTHDHSSDTSALQDLYVSDS